MPRRTNKFQRLVYLIQHQLADGASVTESKLLPDVHSGRPVEVDIVVEGTIGGVRVVVGLECTSGKRPATVEWVNEMAGKHADLLVDKTVLVSRSGFTAEALAKAETHGIEALPLVEAESRDWAGWICNLDALRFAGFTLTPEQVSASVSPGGNVPAGNPLQPDALVREPGSAQPHSFKDYVHGILGNHRLIPQVTRWWLKMNPPDRPMSFRFRVTWNCPPGTTIQAISDEALGLTKILLEVRAEIRDGPLLAQVSRFRERNVVHAEVPDVLTDGGKANILVTLFEEDGAFERGAALVVDPDSHETRVVRMNFPPPEEADS